MDKDELIKALRNELSRNALMQEAKISNYTITKYDRKNITDLGKKITKLREEGKSVREIAEELKCSKSTVSSYCHLVQGNHQIKEKLTKRIYGERKNKKLLNEEIKWIKGAIKKSRYRGTFNYQTAYINYRDSIIEHLDYKCMKCNKDLHNKVPHFHHIDPKKKNFEINSKTRNKTIEEWVAEVNKCSLLCSECHEEVHKFYITNLQRCNITANSIKNRAIDLNKITISKINTEKLDMVCHKSHYLGQSNKNGMPFGFFHNNNIVAAALITSPTRNESKINKEETCELSRFLIIGAYRSKNLASKCLSLLVKELKLNHNYKWLISFSEDEIHQGTIYRAANFVEIGKTKPSYNYEGIHKKTIYERAKKLNMTEHQYASFFNLRRIKENPKTKFSYELSSQSI